MSKDIAQAEPMVQTPRIEVLDALRGFAVFGMFMMNVRVLSGYTYMAEDLKNELLLAQWDFLFDWMHIVFFNGKFYTLFALLFGISYAIQLRKGTTEKRSFIRHFSRRLFFLLIIGMIHLWGVWFSDIVFLYAICGYLLILFRGLSDRGLLWMAFVLLMIPGLHEWYLQASAGGYTNVLFHWLSDTWIQAELPRGSMADEAFQLQDIAMVIHQDSVKTVMNFNALGPLLRAYLLAVDARIFKVMGVFFLGFWTGRKIIMNQLHTKTTFLKKVAIIGWAIGFPLNIIFGMSNMWGFRDSFFIILRNGLLPFGYVLLTLAYAASFILIYQTSFRKILEPLFNAVGKLTLTNYIFQSFAGIFFFYGIGLGLGEYLGSTMLTVAVIVIFSFQVLNSHLWAHHFRYGPIEWIWRMLTYGKIIHNRSNKHLE